MAGDWIKIEHCTPDKPEVMLIAEMLSCTENEVVGGLVRFWIWADQQSRDGRDIRLTRAGIDSIMRLNGAWDALTRVGWLAGNGEETVVPNFDRHNGNSAKKRASVQKRVAKHREGDENGESRNASVTLLKRRDVIPRPLRRYVFERDEGRCVYCGRKEGEYTPGRETAADATLSLDHVIPESKNGETESHNLVTCCKLCNQVKGDRTPDEAGMIWPIDAHGRRYGSVTKALPEKRREENKESGGGAASCDAGASRDCIDDSLPPNGSGSAKKDPSRRAPEIREVFAHYQAYHPKSLPHPKAEMKEWKKVRMRLEEGYTVDQLKQAIDGCHVSPFHCGENKDGKRHQSLELIMRDATHVSQFLEIYLQRNDPVLSEKTRFNKRAADAFLSRFGADEPEAADTDFQLED